MGSDKQTDPPLRSAALAERGQRLSGWWNDFTTLRDFKTAEMLIMLRWKMSISSFQRLVTFAALVAGCVISLLLYRGFLLYFHARLEDRSTVLALGLVLMLYGAISLILAEFFSSRRLAVSALPHLKLFLALDIPLHQVVIRFGGIPCVRRLLVFALPSGLFLSVFVSEGELRLRVVVVAVALFVLLAVGMVWAVLRMASRPPLQSRWTRMIWSVLAGWMVGYVTSIVLSLIGVSGHLEANGMLVSLSFGCSDVPLFVVLGASTSVVLIVRSCVRMWRGLEYRTMMIPSPTARTGGSKSQKSPHMWAAIVLQDLFTSAQGGVLTVFLAVWLAFLSFLVGIASALPLQLEILEEQGTHYATVLTIVLSLTLLAPIVQRIGLSAKLDHFRSLWENGASLASIVTIPLVISSGCGMLNGGGIACADFLLRGSWSPVGPIVGLITVSSAVLSETLVRPPVTIQGTKAHDPGISNGWAHSGTSRSCGYEFLGAGASVLNSSITARENLLFSNGLCFSRTWEWCRKNLRFLLPFAICATCWLPLLFLALSKAVRDRCTLFARFQGSQLSVWNVQQSRGLGSSA